MTGDGRLGSCLTMSAFVLLCFVVIVDVFGHLWDYEICAL